MPDTTATVQNDLTPGYKTLPTVGPLPLPQLELLLCHQVVPDLQTHAWEKEECHQVHELVFVLSGTYRASIASVTPAAPVAPLAPNQSHHQQKNEDGWFTCQAGMGMIYPAMVPHRRSVSRDGGTNLITLQWRTEHTADDGTDALAGPFSDTTGSIRAGLMWLLGLPHTDPERLVQRHALLIAVLEQIRCGKETRNDYLDPIDEIHRFLVETIHYPITMPMLADRSGLGSRRSILNLDSVMALRR